MTVDKTSSLDVLEPSTPGTLLRQAREDAGISTLVMADRLRITQSKLSALEQDQYEKMASETFVRGYLRNYAKLVDLDSAEVIACYERYRGQLRKTTEHVTHAPKVERPQKKRRPLPGWVMPVVGVGLILLWVIVASLVGDGDKTTSQSEAVDPAASKTTLQSPQPAAPSAPQATEQIPATGSQGMESALEDEPRGGGLEAGARTSGSPSAADSSLSTVGTSPAVGTSSAVGTTPAVGTSPAIGTSPETSTSAAEPAVADDTLVFSFNDECWLEVSDAKGDVLYADLQQAGSVLTLKGEAPFNVKMGNARAVQLTFNDTPVTVRPEGTRKTLRMRVGN